MHRKMVKKLPGRHTPFSCMPNVDVVHQLLNRLAMWHLLFSFIPFLSNLFSVLFFFGAFQSKWTCRVVKRRRNLIIVGVQCDQVSDFSFSLRRQFCLNEISRRKNKRS